MLKGTVVNNIGTTLTTIQTVPAGKVHIVLTIIAKNKLNQNISGQVQVVKVSGETIDIIGAVPEWVPYEIQLWEGKLILESGDMIKAISSVDAAIDIMTNYTEEANV